MRAFRRFTVRPVLPEPLGALSVLAGNLRWSWHPPTQDVFSSIDPALWRQVKCDPVRFLGAVGRERLDELAGDHEFRSRLDAAKMRAVELVDRLAGGGAQAMVVTFGAQAQTASNFTTDRGLLRNAIRAIEPTDQPDDVASALRVATPPRASTTRLLRSDARSTTSTSARVRASARTKCLPRSRSTMRRWNADSTRDRSTPSTPRGANADANELRA